MGDELELLKNLISSAQKGNDAAISLLRQICTAAMEKAPPHDLITIGQCLYHVGVEAIRTELGRN